MPDADEGYDFSIVSDLIDFHLISDASTRRRTARQNLA